MSAKNFSACVMGQALYRMFPINQEEKSYSQKNREFPNTVPMDAVRKLITERISALGTTMAEVSRKLGKNHAYLQQFIFRNTNQSLPEQVRADLSEILGVEEDALKSTLIKRRDQDKTVILPKLENSLAQKREALSQSIHTQDAVRPTAELFGGSDLPVFGTAQGGRGALVVTAEAVDWVVRPEPLLRVKDGYGIIISGDSMSPEHKSGSTALVNPHLPPRPGDTCIFRSTAEDGTVHMCIKELVRITDTSWHVRQHNPRKAFKLERSEWQDCHVTVGNYARR